MARRRRRRKSSRRKGQSAWNKKFGRVAKACLAQGGSRATRSACMRRGLKKRG